MKRAVSHAREFCARFRLTAPILEAPMAGVNSVARAAAIANAGGMGAFGALLSTPAQIAEWNSQFRYASKGPYQLNLWVPEPAPPQRDQTNEAQVRSFLSQWGPEVDADAGDTKPPDFTAQFEALLAARPEVASSIMGLFPQHCVRALKAQGVAWFATITTLAEARAAETAGADAIVAQGFEAGGHRGAFDDASAERQAIGLMALLPRLADNIQIPIIAAGGIADPRAIAAALTLGASAVQIGTGFLRTLESTTPKAWANALAVTEGEDTMPTRGFSGRLGRAIATRYVRALAAADAPLAPYPIQRGFTAKMREDAVRSNDLDRMQAWAGQAATLARAEPAGELVHRWWAEVRELLG